MTLSIPKVVRCSGFLIATGTAAAIAIIGLSGCEPSENENSGKVVRASGRIEWNESRLGVMAPGRVASIAVAEGDIVKKGQLLLCLDDHVIASALSNADRLLNCAQISKEKTESALSSLKKQLALSATMHAKGASKMTQLDADLSSASATLTSLSCSKENAQSKKAADSDISSSANAAISESLKAQEDALDEALASQRSTIEKAATVAQTALDESYASQTSALEEAGQTSSKNARFKLWPLAPLQNAKLRAVTEVVSTKKKALDEVYKTKKESLQAERQAQEEALEQSIASKRKTLEQVAAREIAAAARSQHLVRGNLDAQEQKLHECLNGMRASISHLNSFLSAQKSELTSATEKAALRLQVNAAELRLATLKAEIAKAEAARADVQSKRDAFTIVSPFDGICTALNTQPGETVAPGQVLMRVADPRSIYLRAFVSEGELGRIKVGQSCKIFLDAEPHKALMAHVVSVDQQGSFTPENIYFKDDRTRQAFGIKLAIEQPDGRAKSGMPAEAEINVVELASGVH